MLTIVLLLILANGFYNGARRGFVLQTVYTFGYFMAYFVAKNYYQILAPKLELLIPYPSATEDSKFVFFSQQLGLELDQAFYAAIAFLLILFLGWMVIRFVGVFLHRLTFFPVVKQVNTIGGGILGLFVAYVALFLILYALSMVPLDIVQNQFRQSGLARFMVQNTPVLSAQIYDWWISSIIK